MGHRVGWEVATGTVKVPNQGPHVTCSRVGPPWALNRQSHELLTEGRCSPPPPPWGKERGSGPPPPPNEMKRKGFGKDFLMTPLPIPSDLVNSSIPIYQCLITSVGTEVARVIPGEKMCPILHITQDGCVSQTDLPLCWQKKFLEEDMLHWVSVWGH